MFHRENENCVRWPGDDDSLDPDEEDTFICPSAHTRHQPYTWLGIEFSTHLISEYSYFPIPFDHVLVDKTPRALFPIPVAVMYMLSWTKHGLMESARLGNGKLDSVLAISNVPWIPWSRNRRVLMGCSRDPAVGMIERPIGCKPDDGRRWESHGTIMSDELGLFCVLEQLFLVATFLNMNGANQMPQLFMYGTSRCKLMSLSQAQWLYCIVTCWKAVCC